VFSSNLEVGLKENSLAEATMRLVRNQTIRTADFQPLELSE
jgi:hypothetical protein